MRSTCFMRAISQIASRISGGSLGKRVKVLKEVSCAATVWVIAGIVVSTVVSAVETVVSAISMVCGMELWCWIAMMNF